MGKASTLLAAAVLSLFGATVDAAILVNLQAVQGTGALSGFDIYRLYATFSPGSPEAVAGATGLQSAKVTIDATAPLKINFTGLNSPFTTKDDADIYGLESSADASSGIPIDPRTDTANVGTFIRVGPSASSPWAPQYLEANPGPGINLIGKNTTSASNPAATVAANFGSTKHLRVDGILQADTDASALSASNAPGSGALFGVIVLPHGTASFISGQLAANAGPISSFVFFPEPTTLALLGVGALGLLRRRSQA